MAEIIAKFFFQNLFSKNFFPTFFPNFSFEVFTLDASPKIFFQHFFPKFFFFIFFPNFFFQKFIRAFFQNFFLRALLSMPSRLQRRNGIYLSVLWKIWYTASGRNWTLVSCDKVLFFGLYCSHHTRRKTFNFFPATHNTNTIILFSESVIFNWSTQMFSRWYLIAKCIKFWLEVDTPIFLYNPSEAGVKFVDCAN